MFPGKYHQNGGFSMAMLVSGRVCYTEGYGLDLSPQDGFSLLVTEALVAHSHRSHLEMSTVILVVTSDCIQGVSGTSQSMYQNLNPKIPRISFKGIGGSPTIVHYSNLKTILVVFSQGNPTSNMARLDLGW